MAFLFKNNKYCEFVILTPKILSLSRQAICRSHVSDILAKKDESYGKTTSSQHKNTTVSCHTSEEGQISLNEIPFSRKITSQQLEDLIENYIPFEESGFISLISLRCCSDFYPFLNLERKLQLGLKVYSILKKNTRHLTHEHFEALLQCYADNGYLLNLDEFLSEVECLNIQFNEKMYILILKCLCAKGQMEDASKIICKIEQSGIVLNESHYSELIYGYAMLKDWAKVNDLIKLMKSLNVNVGNLTYSSLLKAFSKQGDVSLLKEYYLVATDKGVKLSLRDVIPIIENLALARRLDVLEEVLSWFKTKNTYLLKTLVFRLVHQNCVEGAFCIIKVSVDMKMPNMENSAKYFFRELLKAKTPLDSIISAGIDLVNEGRYENALHTILYFLFIYGTTEDCRKVMVTMKRCGIPLRHHYFWPLITKAYNLDNEKGLVKVLTVMKELKLDFNLSTMVNVILPRIKINYVTPYKLYHLLGWDLRSIYTSIFLHYVRHGQFTEATDLIEKQRNLLNPLSKGTWLTILGRAVLKSPNIDGLQVILKCLNPSKVDNLLRFLVNQEEDIEKYSPRFTEILELLYSYKWGISESCHENLLQTLPETFLTPYNKTLLKNLVEKEINYKDRNHNRRALLINAHSIQAIEDELRADIVTRNYLSDLGSVFNYYCLNNEWAKAAWVKNKMSNQKRESKAVKLSELMFHLKSKDLAKSRQSFDSLSKDPYVVIPIGCVISFCTLLAEKELHKEALKIIRSYARGSLPKRTYFLSLNELMVRVAKESSISLIEEYMDALDHIVIWSYYSAAPCVKCLIEQEMLQEAVTMFEKICLKYNLSPCLVELINLALKKSDKAALQRIRVASAAVLGHRRLILEEMVALSNTGNLEELKKLFNKKININKLLDTKYKELAANGNITELLNFYFALEESTEAEVLLNHIVDCYDRSTDYEGAESFLRILEERGTDLPEKLRARLIRFIAGKELLQNQS